MSPEYKDIVQTPEFQKRADKFVLEVKKLRKKYPNCGIVAENLTAIGFPSDWLEHLKDPVWPTNDEMWAKAERESAEMNAVRVNLRSMSVPLLAEIELKIDEIAARLGGGRITEYKHFDHKNTFSTTYNNLRELQQETDKHPYDLEQEVLKANLDELVKMAREGMLTHSEFSSEAKYRFHYEDRVEDERPGWQQRLSQAVLGIISKWKR